ncbi:MAG: caspase family protein [Gemmatimonadota bacterium]|nr:caspase family protein [Gemmatimonadota bacterium]
MTGRASFVGILSAVFFSVMLPSSAVFAQTRVLTDPADWSGHNAAVTAVAFSPDGQWVASASMDRAIKLWSTDRFHELGTFRGHTGPVWSLTWSPDGLSLISGSEDGTVKIWDIFSRRVRSSLQVSSPVLSVAVSSDGLRLAAGTGERSVLVWNYRSPGRAEMVPGTTDMMAAIRLIPGTTTLIVPRPAAEISLWDAALDEPVGALARGSSPMAVSHDGRWLASGSGHDESIRLWDLPNRRLAGTLNAHTGLVSSIAFSPDASRLVSGSWDSTVRVWDLDRKQLVGTFLEDCPVWTVAFSPDGQWLVAGTDNGLLKRRRVRGATVVASGDPILDKTPSAFVAPDENVERVTVSNVRRPKALGVILGIEDYRYAPDVTFARRDAASMREYFSKALGLTENNIYFRTDRDATQGEFRKVFDPDQGWLAKRINPYETDIFVYYVGHGKPDIATGDSYLMPADSDPNYPATGYRLDELYHSLGRLSAKQVTVMLDACFGGHTGRGRQVEMLLEGTRGIGVSPRRIEVGERLVVLTASAGNQVSSSYPEKSHGLFTYFLMRGLKGEADANQDRAVTIQELYTYVRRQVTTQAGRLDREQTPELWGDDIHRVIVRY